jgi:NADH-quinone oxidoreductase subunit J
VHRAEPGSGEVIGSAVFRTYVLPFEVVSVLLLAALIGAIVLSRPDIGTGERR